MTGNGVIILHHIYFSSFISVGRGQDRWAIIDSIAFDTFFFSPFSSQLLSLPVISDFDN